MLLIIRIHHTKSKVPYKRDLWLEGIKETYILQKRPVILNTTHNQNTQYNAHLCPIKETYILQKRPVILNTTHNQNTQYNAYVCFINQNTQYNAHLCPIKETYILQKRPVILNTTHNQNTQYNAYVCPINLIYREYTTQSTPACIALGDAPQGMSTSVNRVCQQVSTGYRTPTHCNTLQHTATRHVNKCQRTPIPCWHLLTYSVDTCWHTL